jgi:hypothetical protein
LVTFITSGEAISPLKASFGETVAEVWPCMMLLGMGQTFTVVALEAFDIFEETANRDNGRSTLRGTE